MKVAGEATGVAVEGAAAGDEVGAVAAVAEIEILRSRRSRDRGGVSSTVAEAVATAAINISPETTIPPREETELEVVGEVGGAAPTATAATRAAASAPISSSTSARLSARTSSAPAEAAAEAEEEAAAVVVVVTAPTEINPEEEEDAPTAPEPEPEPPPGREPDPGARRCAATCIARSSSSRPTSGSCWPTGRT